MKSTFVAALAALAANEVAGHAMFQQLWVDGVDYAGTCIRTITSNSPVTNPGGRDFVCGLGPKASSGKCPVKAGSTVTVEMHAQPGDRSCGSEAIGGAHHGPVQIYLTKVPDATKADGSTGWFKIFSNSWTKKSGGRVGDDDHWGTRDLNNCCGKMDLKIPADIPNGDYLLRAEALALHTAGQAGGAQFYIACYQITVSGGGSASPATVKIPGAVSANDPGVRVNIHAAIDKYIAPGPPVYAGGSTKVAGSGCTGCESTCKAGSGPKGTPLVVEDTSPAPASDNASAGGGATAGGCAAAVYQQCGGNGFSGCTACAEGATCKASGEYYSQCVPSARRRAFQG